ncbi:MAG: hypothetical protein WCQ16_02810 [Verrucomicrobiae bacterium]
MADGGTTLMLAQLAITAIGTGVSMYGSAQAAANQRKMADYNAQIAAQQAQIQQAVATRHGEIGQYNATLMSRQADASRQAAEFNAQMQERNATTMRAYADNAESQGREQAQRLRAEKLRILGDQQSGYAAAGVTTEGSPLAVLAETDGMLELQIQDSWYQSTQASKKQRGEADMMDWQAQAGRTSGDYSNLLSQASAQMDFQNAAFESATSSAGVRIAQRQADIAHLAGDNQASAYQLQGLSEGIKDASKMTGTLINYNDNAPKSTAPLNYRGSTNIGGTTMLMSAK